MQNINSHVTLSRTAAAIDAGFAGLADALRLAENGFGSPLKIGPETEQAFRCMIGTQYIPDGSGMLPIILPEMKAA